MMDGWAKDALDRLLSLSTFFEGEDDRLTMNVSGTRFEINTRILHTFPDTLLGDPIKRARYLVPGKSDYFFARHSSSFESILYYYSHDGVLIKPETIPALIFYEEIRFFELGDKLTQAFYDDYLAMIEETEFDPSGWWKNALWLAFYHPPISRLGSLFSIFSAVFNALAIYSLCLETMSIYRSIDKTMWMVTHPSKPLNRTEGFKCSDITLRPYQFMPDFNSDNVTLELICVMWFYLELIIRTLSAPSFSTLINDPNFALDILSILPTVLSQLSQRFYTLPMSNTFHETRLFDCLTGMKLIRLLRLTRHAQCLQIFIKVMYINFKALIMLTTLIIFGTFLFGLAQFIFEQMYPENELKTIGEALWHGFTVIITVGYSDIAEYQALSYVLALIGVWYGSISMAIVLPSFTQSFTVFQNVKYRRQTIRYQKILT